jgi:hypothetical protein
MTPEGRARTAARMRMQWTDPTFRGHMASRMRARWTDPTFRAARAAEKDARTRGVRTPSNRRRNGAAARQRWSDPEYSRTHRRYRTIDDVLARTEKLDGGCWMWAGFVHRNGYGMVWFWGRPWLVHRLVYAMLIGEIHGDDEVHHTCRMRTCVRPEHLQALPPEEHSRLTRAMNRTFSGEWYHCGEPDDDEALPF